MANLNNFVRTKNPVDPANSSSFDNRDIVDAIFQAMGGSGAGSATEAKQDEQILQLADLIAAETATANAVISINSTLGSTLDPAWNGIAPSASEIAILKNIATSGATASKQDSQLALEASMNNFLNGISQYTAQASYKIGLPSETPLPIQFTNANNGDLSTQVSGGTVASLKGRKCKTIFTILQLTGGTAPTLTIQGTYDGSGANGWIDLGAMDYKTNTFMLPTAPIDPTGIPKAYWMDNDFALYRLRINNTAGTSSAIIAVSFA
jgi:hypothetical protein